MRIARVCIGAALAVGALGLVAPSPVVADDSGVRISPTSAVPGSTVTVTTTACGKETYGKGVSEVGGQFHLFAGDSKGVLTGHFQIPEDAELGSDTVTVKCPPRIKKTITYEIVRHPSGAVEAGSGGGVDDVNSTDIAMGSVLLAGAVVGSVFWMRRRPGGSVRS